MKIFVPALNGLKFAPLNYFQNCGNNNPALAPNYRTPDNTLMYQEIQANADQNIRHNIGIEYLREPAMPYTSCDVPPIQLKSSFDASVEHKLEVYEHCDTDTVLETITFDLITENREFEVNYNRASLAGDIITDYQGTGDTAYMMYIYFEQGSKYDNSFYDLGNFYLNGELPPEYPSLINSVIEISGSNPNNNGTFVIAGTEYISELNAFAIKVVLGYNDSSLAFDPNNNTGIAKLVHLRDAYNTLQADLDLSAYDDKNLRLKIVADEGNPAEAIIWSEPIMVRQNLPGMLRMSWEHSGDKFYTEFYKNNFKPFAYLPMRLFDILPDEIEDEQLTTDTGKQLFIESTYSERYKVVGWLMPRWMVRLVDVIFKLDEVRINGEQYQKVGTLEAEKETEKSDRFNCELTVNKVNANGVYDDDYDFDHQTLPDNYKYLKIDSDGNRLKIDDENLLKNQN